MYQEWRKLVYQSWIQNQGIDFIAIIFSVISGFKRQKFNFNTKIHTRSRIQNQGIDFIAIIFSLIPGFQMEKFKVQNDQLVILIKI